SVREHRVLSPFALLPPGERRSASIYRGPVELSTIRLIRPLQVSQDVIAREAKQSMASPGDRLREAIHSRYSGAMRTGQRPGRMIRLRIEPGISSIPDVQL